MSTFHQWFVEHYGPRPNMAIGPDHELEARISDGENAQATMKARRAWDTRYMTALSTWNAQQLVHVVQITER